MIRIALLVLLLAIPLAVSAKTVRVRSGEHAGFSRLVLDFETLPRWQFGRVAGGYELRPGHSDDRYDLHRVFDLIPRTRVSQIKAGKNGVLFLAVDCTCHAEAFEAGTRLVLDIKDGKPAADSVWESLLAANPAPDVPKLVLIAQPESARPDETTMPLNVQTAANLPLQFQPQRTALAWNENVAEPPALVIDPLELVPKGLTQEEIVRRAAIQADLLTQISRAAADGLVEPNLEATERLKSRTDAILANTASSVNLPADPPAEPATDPLVAAGSSHIRIQTAIDRSELNTAPPPAVTPEGEVCLDSARVNVANWGQPPNENGAISELRAGLVGEFDAADPASIKALAKHYIYLTFGAEAKGLLGAFDARVDDAGLLTALAEIMDNGSAVHPDILTSQLECKSATALWAVLAKPALSQSDRISKESVLSAFAVLPLHLRRHLGPILADRFLKIGDVATAATIRNSVSRAPGNPGDKVRLMAAEIDLKLGKTESGTAQLADVMREDGPLAPEAVVRLIETRIKAGERIDEKLIESAAAMAF